MIEPTKEAREAYDAALRVATKGMSKFMTVQVRASVLPQVKDAMIAAILAAKAEGRAEVIEFCEQGRFLHDDAPPRRWAMEFAEAARKKFALKEQSDE